jgi:hypothetical protein
LASGLDLARDFYRMLVAVDRDLATPEECLEVMAIEYGGEPLRFPSPRGLVKSQIDLDHARNTRNRLRDAF